MNRAALAAYIYNERARRAHIQGGGRSALQILLSKGADFFYHDFIGRTDLTFQDAAGTTAADDSGEAVALAFSIDQFGSQTLAQVLAAAANQVTNPGPFVNTTGWTVSGGTLSVVDGKLRVTSSGAGTVYITQTLTGVDSGKCYQLTGVYSASTTFNMYTTPAFTGFQANIPNGTAAIHRAATSSVPITMFWTAAGAGETRDLTSVSVKEIKGNHSRQNGATSLRPARQADGSVKGDRLDDNLLQTLTSSTSMFMAAALLGASTPAATAAIIGGPVSTTRGYLARDAAGKLCAGVGADGPSTIVGGSDIAGLKGVAMLNIDASGNVDLEWMPKDGALASLYSAPINGAVAAGTALRLFATNPSGTAANFGGDSLYLASAIQTTLTPAERLALAKDWNARIPS